MNGDIERIKTVSFFDLPRKEQEGLVMEAIKGANELQGELLQRYERSFSR